MSRLQLTIKTLKRVLYILLAVVFLGLLIYSFYTSFQVGRASQPVAEKGYLDLSDWDFDTNGSVSLTGEWEFYWDKLLTPKDFPSSEAALTGYCTVPSAWTTGMVINKDSPFSSLTPSAFGSATYRLRIKLPEKPELLGLKITSIRMSNLLFIQGIESGGSGKTNYSRESYIMANTPYVTAFSAEDGMAELILQVANYDYKEGGIVQSPLLGSHKAVFSRSVAENMIGIFLSASLFIIGIYYMRIYFGRRQNRSAFYFGAYNLLMAFFLMIYFEKIIMQVFPDLPFPFLLRLQNTFIVLSCLFLALFVREMAAGILPKGLVQGFYWVAAIYILATWLVPLSIFTRFDTAIYALGVGFYLIIFVYLASAIIRNRTGALGRAIALRLLGAFLLVLVYYTDGTLYVKSITRVSIVAPLAFIAFIIQIVAILSQQYNEAFNTIERMNTSLLQLDKLKDEFLANTSHELRTPLNGIINIAGSILESGSESLRPEHKQNMAILVQSARRLSGLINDILDISSLKNGEIRLSPKAVDLRSTADLSLYVISQMKNGKPIEFINRIPAEIPPVHADEDRLRQIFDNLIGNALKFTRSGRIEVGASLRLDGAEIWVKDTGCGIPEDKLAEIFTPFYQVKSPDAGGTGLGLSITKNLIELHRGSIRVKSSVGKGSTFFFTLPFSREPKAVFSQQSLVMNRDEDLPLPRLTASSDGRKRKYSILVADDDPASLTALFNILDYEGYFVRAFSDGETLLEELEAQASCNLVILDVMMPGLSGYEVLKKIRDRFKPMEVPVLLLTAKARPEDLQAGFEAGANDYLAKPFEALELKTRVKTLVQLKESVREIITAQLSFLQAQIKPHFLYNALNVIISLSSTSPKRATELLYSLSDYLRGSFNFENYDGITPLQGELSTVRAYVAIEQERFGDKLKMEYSIDENINVSVPMLAIQPLVENAIRHGILQKREGGRVRLTVRSDGEDVVISVEDTGVGIPPEKLNHLLSNEQDVKGIGLANIQRRMLLYYGQKLTIQSVENQGTVVVMRIPGKLGMTS